MTIARRLLRHQFLRWPVVALFLMVGEPDNRGRADEKQALATEIQASSPMDERARAASAACSAVAVNQPLAAFALLQAGMGFSLWSGLSTNQEQESSKVPPLVNLESVKDEESIRSGEEGLAFCEALVKAHKTSEQLFQNSVTRGVTYANLFHEPQLYRGKVVHFEGRLKRLIRWEPPEETKLDGVTDQYEGWMFNPEILGANPICVFFTDLPAGLEPGDKLDVRVAFDGYFFKKRRYKAGDGLRDAPVLIGHTITVKQGPAKSDSEEGGVFSGVMAIMFLVLLGALFVLAFVLTLWYRRSDRYVQTRLSNAQASSFVDPSASLNDIENQSTLE
jgi:hypothetical protein